MWLLIGVVVITILSVYFSGRLGKDHLLFNTFVFFFVSGFLLIPSLIIFLVLEHYDVVEEYQVIPVTLPILIIGFFAVWATWEKPGRSRNDSHTVDKKDDFTSDAIIMTAVLSDDDEKSDTSSNSNSSGSNSSGSSSSSSSSNSDDFFF